MLIPLNTEYANSSPDMSGVIVSSSNRSHPELLDVQCSKSAILGKSLWCNNPWWSPESSHRGARLTTKMHPCVLKLSFEWLGILCSLIFSLLMGLSPLWTNRSPMLIYGSTRNEPNSEVLQPT